MAELTTTAASISLRSGNNPKLIKYGETIVPPQPVYLKAADSKYYAGDANVSTAEAAVTQIAMTPGVADEYGVGVTIGDIDIGATTVVGETYILGAAKGWAPAGDYVATWYKTILGTASDTVGTVTLDIKATGQVKA